MRESPRETPRGPRELEGPAAPTGPGGPAGRSEPTGPAGPGAPGGLGGSPVALGHELVRGHTVYACVMGSRAFGLATEASDTDRRGVYVAPTPLFWRFDKPPTHVSGPRDEEFSWEIERFCSLALRANPNLLECLHSPLVEFADATGRELLELRDAFLSRRVEATFRGYAEQQLGRLEADIRQHGEPRWKHAMHLVRLLVSCRDLLRTGTLAVDVGEQREELLAVRRGEVGMEELRGRLRALHDEVTAAADRTPLPAEPDRARVEDFLVRVRRASVRGAA